MGGRCPPTEDRPILEGLVGPALCSLILPLIQALRTHSRKSLSGSRLSHDLYCPPAPPSDPAPPPSPNKAVPLAASGGPSHLIHPKKLPRQGLQNLVPCRYKARLLPAGLPHPRGGRFDSNSAFATTHDAQTGLHSRVVFLCGPTRSVVL